MVKKTVNMLSPPFFSPSEGKVLISRTLAEQARSKETKRTTDVGSVEIHGAWNTVIQQFNP